MVTYSTTQSEAVQLMAHSPKWLTHIYLNVLTKIMPLELRDVTVYIWDVSSATCCWREPKICWSLRTHSSDAAFASAETNTKLRKPCGRPPRTSRCAVRPSRRSRRANDTESSSIGSRWHVCHMTRHVSVTDSNTLWVKKSPPPEVVWHFSLMVGNF